MRRAWVVFAVVAVIAATVGFLVLSSQNTTKTRLIKDKKVIRKLAVAFVRNPYKDDYGISRIAGYVQDLSGSKIARAHLEIQLSDRSGNRKELIKYDVTDIAAYSRRTFDANAGPLGGERRANVKITEIEVAR